MGKIPHAVQNAADLSHQSTRGKQGLSLIFFVLRKKYQRLQIKLRKDDTYMQWEMEACGCSYLVFVFVPSSPGPQRGAPLLYVTILRLFGIQFTILAESVR